MTDTMFTHTALTATALLAGVTTDQARAILEAAGVTVQPEKPAPGWYLTEDGEVARVKPNKHTGALILHIDGDVLLPHQPWPELTPARVVPVAAAPVTLTEDQVGEVWDKDSVPLVAWRVLGGRNRERITATVNAALAQHAAPAEGEQIDPRDVREGDRVHLVSKHGDEVTLTVRTVTGSYICSAKNLYDISNFRSIHLLHREDQP